MKRAVALLTLAVLGALPAAWAGEKGAAKAGPNDNMPPPGFKALFNGKDLSGWQAVPRLRDQNYKKWKSLSAEERAAEQDKADRDVLPHWKAVDGILVYDGKGYSIRPRKEFGDFELYVDWKIGPKGDSGIYLRGNPQVQIWEATDKAAQKDGKFVGSGGLYNNQKHPRDPIAVADNPAGEWNTFHIKMVGDKVTVKLNGKLVVDNTPLENYFERGQPLPARGSIELQHHGNPLYFKNIYIKELSGG